MASWLDHLDDTTPAILRPEAEFLVPALTILAHPDLTQVGQQALLLGFAQGAELLVGPTIPEFASPSGGAFDGLGGVSTMAWFEIHGQTGALSLVATRTDLDLEINGTPLDGSRKVDADELADGVAILIDRRLALVLHWQDASPQRPSCYGLLGEGPAMLRVRREIERLARLRFNVLLHGEPGTGKEAIARAIHDDSPRAEMPFLSLRLAELDAAEVGPTLFGAGGTHDGRIKSRRGLFLEADGGTLYLDQVGETPTEVHRSLLHTLESGEILPHGGRGSVEVDVRVIATTDTEAPQLTLETRSRLSLLHRLGGYEIYVPSLRQRRDDFGRLFLAYLQQLAADGERPLDLGASTTEPLVSAELLYRLALQPWSDNLPQLERLVEHLLEVTKVGQPMQWTVELESLAA